MIKRIIRFSADNRFPVIAGAVADKFRGLFAAGWRPTEREIARDVRALCGGAFAEFLAK